MRKVWIVAGLLVVGMAVAATKPWVRPPTADAASLRKPPVGPVVGIADTHDSFAWLGIPFAQPPVGSLRWRAPQPTPNWTDPRPALALSAPCAQLNPVSVLDKHAVNGSEDCLYLNIWAPRMTADAAVGRRLPVMVWIHGGGNSMGLAGATRGAHLAGAQQLVVVTLQYRLGYFGWLSHPALRRAATDPADGSSNFGLLDQIAALRWVRDNIGAFGGDPGNVTIFGESAGAHDVLALLASPQAKGLFHRAISQSGSLQSEPVATAENYADDPVPGSPDSSRELVNRLLIADGKAPDRAAAKSIQQSMGDDAVLAYLRAKSTKEILAAASLRGLGMYEAVNIIRDGYAVPDRPFRELFADPAQYNAVPIILGTNRDESKLFMMGDPTLTEKRFGFLPSIKDVAVYNRMTGYSSDVWKAASVDEAAAILARSQGDSVYTYRLDWDQEPDIGPVKLHDLLGAAHSIDVNFVFGDESTTGLPFMRSRANGAVRDALSASMMAYWGAFARTGSPGTGGSAGLPAWTPWRPDGQSLLVLNTPEGGGIRMTDTHLTIADLKQRLRSDPALSGPGERCRLYRTLFHGHFNGRDFWDEAEYRALGCDAVIGLDAGH